MIRVLQGRAGMVWLAGVLLLSSVTSAQQKPQVFPETNRAYETSREVSLQGTVVRFVENSTTAPFGAHVTVQTASGLLDLHLGDARLLDNEHFTLTVGDEIRVIGENVAVGTGTQFVARIIQKGIQAVALRSMRGLPLRPTGASKNVAGVL